VTRWHRFCITPIAPYNNEKRREDGMTTKLVKGTPVVSLADGTTLGAIDHVYFDPRRMAVVGFTFHQRAGLFGPETAGLVDISDVHAFGPDAVTVDDLSVVRSELAVELGHDGLLDMEDLIRREVMTEGGTLIGYVAAIQFGDHSHALVALEVTANGAANRRRIGAGEILTIGPELVIVRDRARAAHRLHVLPTQGLQNLTSISAPLGARERRGLTALGA
jgi:uncharacterized protein YrrD